MIALHWILDQADPNMQSDLGFQTAWYPSRIVFEITDICFILVILKKKFFFLVVEVLILFNKVLTVLIRKNHISKTLYVKEEMLVIFMCLHYKSFENTAGKGEITRNK